ncbi:MULTISPECIES: LysR substrate-binding domain-containing protein [Burkholderia]|uniref:LysR substrate-binding domain-containing protein n=1 Tax=Burkholderia TaxID=32008 RepID=UPI00084196EF|nr:MULTISPECIES: LysR substrate-binding domain-containing protein [unclassified Burkholderia]AOK31280.1 hypothetical protein AQ611_16885 [Burkholderia sp. Bp7605]
MLDFSALAFFVQVLEKKSITAASETLSVPKSTVSRSLIRLEEELGVLLLQRSTRRITPTDAGLELYDYARAILNDVESATMALRRRATESVGTIRISCSHGFSAFVVSTIIDRFMLKHPQIRIMQHITDKFVDLPHDGIDVLIRAHHRPLPDSGMVQRPLGKIRWGLFANPRLLAEYAPIVEPNDVEKLPMLSHHTVTAERLILDHPTLGQESLTITPRFCGTDMLALKKLAQKALGAVALPTYICKPEIADGTLQRILPDWTAGTAQLTVLMTSSRQGPLPAIREFVDFLVEAIPGVVND